MRAPIPDTQIAQLATRPQGPRTHLNATLQAVDHSISDVRTTDELIHVIGASARETADGPNTGRSSAFPNPLAIGTNPLAIGTHLGARPGVRYRSVV